MTFATARAALRHALCAASLLFTGPVPSAQAADTLAFVVPAEEGYGIEDCMQAGRECGRVMANAWCEAHGHVRAVAYGSSDDVTGAIPASDKVFQVATGGVIIRCAD